MLSFTGSLKVYLAVEPCDLRKGFDGLASEVGERLGAQVKSGALFVFCNRRKTRLKVLYWDGSGIWLLTNSHAPQCAVRFISEDPVSLPSLLRPRARSLRRRWRET